MDISQMYQRVGFFNTNAVVLNTYPKTVLCAWSIISGIATAAFPFAKRLVPSALQRLPVAILVGGVLAKAIYHVFASSLHKKAEAIETHVKKSLKDDEFEIRKAFKIEYNINSNTKKIVFGETILKQIEQIMTALKTKKHLKPSVLPCLLKVLAEQEKSAGNGFVDDFFLQLWTRLENDVGVVGEKLSQEALCDVWRCCLNNQSYVVMKELIDKKLVPDLAQAPDGLIQQLGNLFSQLDDELFKKDIEKSLTTGKGLLFTQNLPLLFTTSTNKKNFLNKMECIEEESKKRLMASLVHLFYLNAQNVQESIKAGEEFSTWELPNVIGYMVIFSSLPNLCETFLEGWRDRSKKKKSGTPAFSNINLYSFWDNFFISINRKETQAYCMALFDKLMKYDELVPGEAPLGNIELQDQFVKGLETLKTSGIIPFNKVGNLIGKYCQKQGKQFPDLLSEANSRATARAL